jgi:hypothetical protein
MQIDWKADYEMWVANGLEEDCCGLLKTMSQYLQDKNAPQMVCTDDVLMLNHQAMKM